MKVYSISKWAFTGISLLILALPVSRHWRLITGGNRADGKGISCTEQTLKAGDGTLYAEYISEILFQAGDRTMIISGPEGIKYKTGRRIIIYYDPDNPEDNCIFTFASLYLSNYSVLPLMLLIFWAAFYLSFNRKIPTSLTP